MNVQFHNQPASPGPAASAGQSDRPARILYVEDDILLADVFRELLTEEGYHVDIAHDGEAGWEALQRDDYDLLITDNDMPRLSGVGLIARLRTAGQDLPVIIASGSYSPEEAQINRWLEVMAVVEKPFTAEELCLTIALVLAARQGQAEPWAFYHAAMGEPADSVRHIPRWGINE